MAYPVVIMRRSALLVGQSNGRLDPSIMRSVDAGGNTDVLLIHPAARSWKAMAAAAARAGVFFPSNGSYRTYARQVELFTSRYTTRYLPGRPYKVWNGRRWYQRPGTPVTAVPGTSNHGWGCAIDHLLTSHALAWLLANETRFGYSHELQSESWHIRYWAGDNITAAVLAYERAHGKPPDPKPPEPPEPEPPDEELLEDDMPWILQATGKPTRLMAPPLAIVADKATIDSARYSGYRIIVATPADYDEIISQVTRALD